jgi:hypothetical protein
MQAFDRNQIGLEVSGFSAGGGIQVSAFGAWGLLTPDT